MVSAVGFFRKVRGVLGLCCLGALAGCSRGVLAPVGPVGAAQRLILFDAVAIMMCIVVPTIAATLAFAWWFRAGNAEAERLPTFAFSGKVEVVAWSVPLLAVVFLGGIARVGSHELDPARPLSPPVEDPAAKPLEVQVVALDWKWLFVCPDQGIASLDRLVIPSHTPVHLSLTSASVMDTFWVPQLGSMIYVMNGMADQLNLRADREGTFPGLSGNFSGDGFSHMRFDAVAMPRDGFATWAVAFMVTFVTGVLTGVLLTMVAQVWAKAFRADVLRRLMCWTLFWHALDIVRVGVFTVVYEMGVTA